jgi:hypothetical protein
LEADVELLLLGKWAGVMSELHLAPCTLLDVNVPKDTFLIGAAKLKIQTGLRMSHLLLLSIW